MKIIPACIRNKGLSKAKYSFYFFSWKYSLNCSDWFYKKNNRSFLKADKWKQNTNSQLLSWEVETIVKDLQLLNSAYQYVQKFMSLKI